MNRKIIQIQTFISNTRSTEVWVLCDDGSVWRRGLKGDGSTDWIRVDVSTIEAHQ